VIKLDIKLQQEIVNVNKGVFIYDIVADFNAVILVKLICNVESEGGGYEEQY
jgi:hypothetical protein